MASGQDAHGLARAVCHLHPNVALAVTMPVFGAIRSLIAREGGPIEVCLIPTGGRNIVAIPPKLKPSKKAQPRHRGSPHGRRLKLMP